METGCKFFKAVLNYLGDELEFENKLTISVEGSSLTNIEINMFRVMFCSFGFMQKIQCAYFKCATYTDGKYTLNVRKDLHNRITIMFDVNPHYSGDWLK